jgi:hypothetical protein
MTDTPAKVLARARFARWRAERNEQHANRYEPQDPSLHRLNVQEGSRAQGVEPMPLEDILERVGMSMSSFDVGEPTRCAVPGCRQILTIEDSHGLCREHRRSKP